MVKVVINRTLVCSSLTLELLPCDISARVTLISCVKVKYKMDVSDIQLSVGLQHLHGSSISTMCQYVALSDATRWR